MSESGPSRRGEYASRGDYHRELDRDWEFWPSYVAKIEWVRTYLDPLPQGTRVVDVGCGEGVLVEEYAHRLAIEGVDANYASDRVQRGSALALPFADGTFRCALCLDVLEHLGHAEQNVALGELHRVLEPGGLLLLSVPNLAHLQSRLHFLFTGKLIRTASETKHPGDRPAAEYIRMIRSAGFAITERRGVFPTVPVLTHLIRRHPRRLSAAHGWLTRALPVPGWCFLNLFAARRPN